MNSQITIMENKNPLFSFYITGIDFIRWTCQTRVSQVRLSWFRRPWRRITGCQTAHCGRHKPHFDFGELAFPIVPYRHLPQVLRSLTADCVSHIDRRSRSQCCHVQYCRNCKSQQSECVPVSLHRTALYAGLQKWARRHRKAVTVEWFYKGTLLRIDWCWKSNTGTPWATASLGILSFFTRPFRRFNSCLLNFAVFCLLIYQ